MRRNIWTFYPNTAVLLCSTMLGLLLIGCMDSPPHAVAPSSAIQVSVPLMHASRALGDFDGSLDGAVPGNINANTLVVQKVDIGISADFARASTDGEIYFAFTNRIPAKIIAHVGFFDRNPSTNTLDTTLALDSIGPIASAHIGLDGSADSAVISYVTVPVTGAQLEAINQSDSVAVFLNLTAASGRIVNFHTTDSIFVSASASFQYTINKP